MKVTTLTEIEAAILVRMSPELLRWFTTHAPKHGEKRMLPFTEKSGEYFYDQAELLEFDRYLRLPWPISRGATRPNVPSAVQRELLTEANHHCAFCDRSHRGEGAHIDPVHKSQCNHPHNLIWSCPNHHDEYDMGYKLPTVLTEEQVRFIKGMLLEGRVRMWRIELRAISSYLSVIDALEKVADGLEDKRNAPVSGALLLHANSLLDAAAKSAAHDAKSPLSRIHERYVKKIAKLAPVASAKALRTAVAAADTATNAYLLEAGLVECPLCSGLGEHNRHRCPVCAGDGTVPSAHADEINLRPFRQVECLLCHGTTEHNRAECPVCLGIGTIDDGRTDQLDLRPFKQVQCPLCHGSTEHNRVDCPVCAGVGTIDQAAEESLDLRPYRQVKCPVCKGRGDYCGKDCPVCRAVGTVDEGLAESLDLGPYKLAECPVCRGSGVHRRHDCPVCSGSGKVPLGIAESLDTAPYRQVECPLCDGSGNFHRQDCPFCGGQGNVDAGAAESFDPSDFRGG